MQENYYIIPSLKIAFVTKFRGILKNDKVHDFVIIIIINE